VWFATRKEEKEHRLSQKQLAAHESYEVAISRL
jgi:hypothetical protein